jgi:acetyl-CoA C-acetyltransferase
MEAAVILSACRTPIGSFGGAFKTVSAIDLGAVAIREAVARAGVDAATLDDVIMGCVLQAGAGMNVARQAAIRAGVPVTVPAVTVNRVCGSGLQAVIDAQQAIAAGAAHAIVAGGVESMSNAPYLLSSTRWGARLGNVEATDSMVADGLTCALAGCHMGSTAEEIATLHEVTRDDQDAFAAESQRRAAAAIRGRLFGPEIAPVEVPAARGPAVTVDTDEHPRPDTNVEALARLRPAFRSDGTVTAGNASGISDGAAAVVVASETRTRELGAEPLARIVSYATAGVDPMVMGLGPIPAVQRALARAGWRTADVDLFELNEAFAAQAVAVIRTLDLDPALVNIRGGAIALGHPLGASGARILCTLIHALRDRGKHRGVAALCIGGGQGIALAVEV